MATSTNGASMLAEQFSPARPTDLAGFVFLRSQRAQYLIASLRDALDDMDRPDLIEILDLVDQDVTQSLGAAERARESQACTQNLQTLIDLQTLAGLGGPKAKALVLKMATRLPKSLVG